MKTEFLSQAYIQENTHSFFHTVEIADFVTSTNDVLKSKAACNRQGYVLISRSQSAGKGRNGKSFYSEKGKGIYMSLLLKPRADINRVMPVTACGAVAASQAIEQTTGVKCGIKWVNDIYISGKKVAGILCETALKAGTAQLEYLVLGIGINLYPSDFPAEIQDTAGCVADFAESKPEADKIICRFLNSFYHYYSNLPDKSFLAEYREKSVLTGKEIILHENNKSCTAVVVDIGDNGGLVVRLPSGQQKTLLSGEITVRKKKSSAENR